MCGIAGFLGPWPESLVRAMTRALAHRGPDGEGVVFDAAARLGLGHRRLAIIDLSDAAAQPMATPDGRYAITYNGEIYNYRALRRALEQEGVRFRTQSDTEVLLHAFVSWGKGCLDRLSGIFAFAIWDREAQSLFLARDPLGVKPLYYASLPHGFLFASELKALALAPDLPREIDPEAVADHLGFVWSAGEATMLRAVKKLRPGHCLTVDAAGVRIDRYWRAPIAEPAAGAGDAAALARLIDEVVADQMVADVPVGALLSGGVDSSAIVAAMCRATEPALITTFCAASPRGGAADNFGDDARYARAVAARLGVRLVEVPTDPALIDELPEMVWRLDEPTADFAALQTEKLAHAARAAGITVLLSGTGGDDLFTGYGRHTAGLVYAALGRVPGLRSAAGRVLAFAPPGSLAGRRARRLGQLLALPEDAMLVEAMCFSEVDAAGRSRLLAPELRARLAGHVPQAIRESLDATRGRHPVARMIDLELNAFLPDHNLNYTDKMAMRAGVEVRVPLADPKLVAFAQRLSVADRIDLRTTKRILRDSQRGRIPDSVLARPKQGFGVPMRAWLAGPARGLMEELTGERAVAARGLFDARAAADLRRGFLAGRIDAAMSLFPMMAVELWCRALAAWRPAEPAQRPARAV